MNVTEALWVTKAVSPFVTTMSPFVTTVSGANNDKCPAEYAIFTKIEEVYAGRPHCALSIPICVFGVIGNAFNIIVLTRKHMISSTNFILTAIAISEFLIMLLYFFYALHFHCIYPGEDNPDKFTTGAALFLTMYANINLIVHSTALWLTVILSLFRLLFINLPRKGAIMCGMQQAKIAVGATVLASIVVSIPNFMTYTIFSQAFRPPHDNTTVTYIRPRSLTPLKRLANQELIEKINFWFQAVLIKLVPCIMLLVLSVLLIKFLRKAEKRRGQLINRASSNGKDNRAKTTNRTTKMLLAIAIIFVITSLPQSILFLASGLDIDDNFFKCVNNPLGYFLDIAVLVNSSINFILYSTMSKQFRDTFKSTFRLSAFSVRGGKTKSSIMMTESGRKTQGVVLLSE